MYVKPSARRIKRKPKPLNLVPILDAVFILIFYLLMSAQFFKTFEVGSDYPMTSNKPAPPKEKEALNLMVNILKDRVEVYTGMPEKIERTFSISQQNYLELLNEYLVQLKEIYPNEKSVVINPEKNVDYKLIINVLDYIRKDQQKDEETTLFEEVVVGNVDL